MTLKQRIYKLENKLGIKKMFVFEMQYGLDIDAITAHFCEENDIDQSEENMFIFIQRFTMPEFGLTPEDWKFLYQTAI